MVKVQKPLPLADELAAVAASASGLLLSEHTVGETLKLITVVAKFSVPDAVGAGVTLIDSNARQTSTAASDEVVEQTDALQYELELGPCLSAWATGETVVVDDIAHETRWPLWSQAVASLPVASSISVPLKSADELFGAVKIYADRPRAFDERSRQALELLARQATVLLEHATTAESARKLSEELQHALRSRDFTGLAKGLLMERNGVIEEGAMRLLMRKAVTDDATLHEVAVRLVEAATPQGTQRRGLVMEIDDDDLQLKELRRAMPLAQLTVGEVWLKYFAILPLAARPANLKLRPICFPPMPSRHWNETWLHTR